MRQRLLLLLVFLVGVALVGMPSGVAHAEAPVISSIAPSTGSNAGGTVLTIYGGNFQPGGFVSVGGVLATNVTYINSSMIQATTPPNGATGTVQVVVINPDGQSTYVAGFTYTTAGATNSGSLYISSINPAAGNPGQPIYVTGAGFDANTTISFGGIAAPAVNVVNSGYLITYAPSGGSGTVNVTVSNGQGMQGTSPQQFTFTGTSTSTGSAATISSVSPSVVSAGNTIAISGSGFLSGAVVTVGGYVATSVTVASSTLITATAPSGPSGTVTVGVTNPGATAVSYTGVTYGGTSTTTASGTQPTVASISPASGSSAGGTTVSISGSGFGSPSTVTFGGAPATNVTVVSPNLITAVSPANPVGTVSVLVAGPGGAVGGLTSGFTYQLAVPLVNSITPSTGALIGGTTLTITGTGFAPGATVTVGSQPAPTVSAVTPTQIIVTTPPGAPGPAVVLVTNPGGAISGLAGAFSYTANPQPQAPTPAPSGTAATVTGVSPSTGPQTGGTPITITGTGFAQGATVSIGSTAVTATVVSSTQISATTPPVSGTGSVTVTVTNPGAAAASLPTAFTYTASATTTPPPSTSTGSTGTSTGGAGSSGGSHIVPPGGGLFVFSGGTSQQLLEASGCSASTAIFWTTDSAGKWIGYIPSVPVAIVNAAWTALFPNGIPANTPIYVRC